MSYKNYLYFYAMGQDYLDLVEQIEALNLYVLPPWKGAETDLYLLYGDTKDGIGDNVRLRYLSLKPMAKVRECRLGGFTVATYDVVSWTRGYVYKDQQLVGHMIMQHLPFFKEPNPTEKDLLEFEDARALRKVMSHLRRWMKKNWVDYYNDGDYFGPEALRLKIEEGYKDASLELDNMPPTTYVYPNGLKLTSHENE